MQDQARLGRHHSYIEEWKGWGKGYDRGPIKELRNSCRARQGRVMSMASYIDKLVCFLRFMRQERGATEGEVRG
jgi:hypothetical protein